MMSDAEPFSKSENLSIFRVLFLQVYFEISIDERPAGKVVFELYADRVRC